MSMEEVSQREMLPRVGAVGAMTAEKSGGQGPGAGR
jgi:hypothetical protein